MIGRGHAEFSSKQQQDAQEFYLHLLTVMERENRKANRTEHAFKPLQFEVEDRHECGMTKKVWQSGMETPNLMKKNPANLGGSHEKALCRSFQMSLHLMCLG